MTQPAYDRRVGSVAEEAARLIGLFSTVPDSQAEAAGEGASRPTGASSSRPPHGEHPPVGSSSGAAGGSPSQVCPECGHDPAASEAASVCRSCPVCILIGAVRSVTPDTIDRLADVVDLIGDGLRGFAASRREAAAARPKDESRP
ncbi:MAG TPA: hypothetical protein PKC73_07845 [Dermatophilaceae bacterium]|nr:hypothetical protein [Dermatophilaceae bacterium]